MSLGWDSTKMGGWTIDGVVMAGPGWRPVNLEVLWQPPPNRGTNRVVPGVAGSLARRRVQTERRVDVLLLIGGQVDQAGTPHSDPTEGLVANIDTIWTIVEPPVDATRTSIVTMPDGTTRTAEIQVEAMTDAAKAGPNLARAALTITIPAGAHV